MSLIWSSRPEGKTIEDDRNKIGQWSPRAESRDNYYKWAGGTFEVMEIWCIFSRGVTCIYTFTKTQQTALKSVHSTMYIIALFKRRKEINQSKGVLDRLIRGLRGNRWNMGGSGGGKKKKKKTLSLYSLVTQRSRGWPSCLAKGTQFFGTFPLDPPLSS